jgi:hypothetical protein
MSDRFRTLERASKYLIRREYDSDKAEAALWLAGGHTGDVVGKNETVRVYCCFANDGEVRYVCYDSVDLRSNHV